MPDGDTSYIGPIDLKALSPKQRDALKQRIIRRAHAQRAQAIGAMFAWLLDCLRPTRRSHRRIPGCQFPVAVPEGPTEA